MKRVTSHQGFVCWPYVAKKLKGLIFFTNGLQSGVVHAVQLAVNAVLQPTHVNDVGLLKPATHEQTLSLNTTVSQQGGQQLTTKNIHLSSCALSFATVTNNEYKRLIIAANNYVHVRQNVSKKDVHVGPGHGLPGVKHLAFQRLPYRSWQTKIVWSSGQYLDGCGLFLETS